MAVQRATEIELKYAVGDAVQVPALDGLVVHGGTTTVVAVPPVALEAVYFDTADRVLLAARIALRRRVGGHDEGWHVKLPAPKGRVELQAPLAEGSDGDAVAQLPPGLERALRTRVRGRDLVPIARIRTVRTAVVVSDGQGERVEVVDDAVTATDVAAGTVRSWREWEAEQIGDDPDAAARVLTAVDGVLLAAGATRSSSPAKLAQALGLVGVAEPAPESSTAASALTGLLAPLVEQLHRDALALADGTDDDVHGMRKTLRRLRSLLALEVVAGPSGRALRDRLRSFGEPLGAVRDPVVAADFAEALLDGLDPELPDLAAARARLVDAPRREAGPARLAVGEAIASGDALDVYAALEAFLVTGGDGPSAGAATSVLRETAVATLRRAAKRAKRIGDDLESLHDARKAARRARFVIEAFVAGGLVRPRSRTARLAAAAERVQDALGAHRDLAVLVEGLPAAAAAATAAGENAFVLGVLAERGGRDAERLRRRALSRLHRFASAARR